MWFREPSKSLSRREKISNRFETSLKTVMTDFGSQNPRFWKAIKAASNAVLKTKEPNRPAITMIVVSPGSEQTANCLVKHLGNSIHRAYQSSAPTIVFSQPENSTPEESKLLLDERLESAFAAGIRVGWIQRLEQLHGEAAMMLHSYCDNEFANYKDAHLYFTVHVPESMAEEDEVEAFLAAQWSSLAIDQFSALWSRISNNMVFVQPENDTSLCQK
ncbi:hypothetical protein CAPTEDRAFT_108634 [Capitella teleta]|uniref:Torsin-1A-interacting protein 1/2 AAA+ activator domain-containing protein n=1 Tax=Capitella teleta TaxID=283909 RepID=R7VEM3_CAPTE|nr:hypothetical protein CAPTEDRAFT_108634 [Capitella teleta]|eukprot:ELU17037.1 hypothetical protein CAPTEDRAFT_108634 [Capitella teleta]